MSKKTSKKTSPSPRKASDHGIIPTEYHVLIKPEEVKEKVGSIFIPDSEKDKYEVAQVTGIFIAAGGNAFEDWKGARPGPGDRVYFRKYTGDVMIGQDGETYRLCTDKDIGAVVESGVVSSLQLRRALGKSEGIDPQGGVE